MKSPFSRFCPIAPALMVLLITSGIALGADPAPTVSATTQIERLLTEQAAAWNRGDIDAFMEYYAKSDELTFSSRGKVTRGWTATKEGYKRRYATREQMGTLTFDGLEVTPLGGVAALVLGRWHLKRDAEPIGGVFSLVLRRNNGQWRIIHDHTSASEE